jgi:uncharacterized protein involved in response to NO
MLLWLIALYQPAMVPEWTVPMWWHVHEMLFGYLAAVITGFLLTAVPNWTGRAPLTGMPLAALFALWLFARLANGFFAPSLWLAILDCLLLLSLSVYLWTQIIAAKNYRNLLVAIVVSLLSLAHGLWYWDLLDGGFPQSSQRVTLAALACLLTVMGGRLVPNFSRNWLHSRGVEQLPAPVAGFDHICVAVTVAAMAAWCIAPQAQLSGVVLILAGVLNALRLYRWRGWTTAAEPLVLVLHAGYLWLPVAFLLLGAEIVRADLFVRGAGVHALTAGAAGVLTIAVMTRATLGHSGQPLTADRLTVVMYALVFTAALIRVLAPYAGLSHYGLHALAGVLWAAGFTLFCVGYGRYFVGSQTG